MDPKTVAAIEANSLKSYCTTTTGGSVGSNYSPSGSTNYNPPGSSNAIPTLYSSNCCYNSGGSTTNPGSGGIGSSSGGSLTCNCP